MARNHARIYTSIWNDKDFIDLTPNAQWVYQMLVSEPTLSHAGVLSITARRWARRAKGATAELIMDGIYELAATRFVVIDEDTEELLVRSLIRHDGVWKQPKILGCAITEASVITSAALRAEVLTELRRIDPSGLSDKVRPDVEALLNDLPEALTQAHTEGPIEGPTEPPRNPPPKGPAKTHVEGARGRGGNGSTEVLTSPPSTLPLPRAPRAQARSTLLGNSLLDEHLQVCRGPVPRDVKQRTGEKIDALLEDGFTAEQIRAGLELMRARPGKGPGLLSEFVQEADAIAASPNVSSLPATGTDSRYMPQSGSRVPTGIKYSSDPKDVFGP